MKKVFFLRRKALPVGIAVVVGLLGPVAAQGRASLGKIEFDNLPSPTVSAGKDKSFKPKDWLEFETGITIPALTPDQKASGFIDQVVVKWAVAIKNPEGRGFLLLTKDINHINVPVNEEIFSSVYLSPSTLKRLTGSDKAGKSAVDRVLVEVLVNGRSVGAVSSKGGTDWLQTGAGSLSDQSSRFPLLNKYETPFKMFWWDRYAEIQENR